jgi:D-threo-aldose 1-dehydrogenase
LTQQYRKLDTTIAEDRAKIEWRKQFFEICKTHQVKPVEACVQFGKSHPAIAMLALSASEPQHIEENIAAIRCEIPATFWIALQIAGLIERNHPHY